MKEKVNKALLRIVLKVVSAAFLQVCFVCLRKSTCETRKNAFLFHFESSSRS